MCLGWFGDVLLMWLRCGGGVVCVGDELYMVCGCCGCGLWLVCRYVGDVLGDGVGLACFGDVVAIC